MPRIRASDRASDGGFVASSSMSFEAPQLQVQSTCTDRQLCFARPLKAAQRRHDDEVGSKVQARERDHDLAVHLGGAESERRASGGAAERPGRPGCRAAGIPWSRPAA